MRFLSKRAAIWTQALFCGLALAYAALIAGQASASEGALPLNGIGTYTHLGKDYYWVAHHTTESCTTRAACENASKPSKYTIRVVTRRWTPQNYRVMWERDLAMANSKVPLGLDIDAVLAFSELAHDKLTRGDTIDIVFNGRATKIYFNGLAAVSSPGKSLYNYLAGVWIGKVPPTRAFKQNLLKGHNGQHDEGLIEQFNHLRPDKERLLLVRNWQREKAAQANVKPAVRTAKLSATSRGAASASASNITNRKSTVAAINVTDANVVENASAEAKASETGQANKITKVEPVTQVEKVTKVEKAVKAKKTKKRQPAAPSKSQALDIYTWQVQSEIYDNVKYPVWAKQFKREGTVTATFIIDTDMNVSIESVNPENQGLLGDAVKRAINAANFPLTDWPHLVILPKTFSYTHVFDLKEASPKPELASSLDVFLNRQKTAARDMGDALKQHLAANIKYPFWAVRQDLEGEVVAKITLDASGNVIESRLTEKSKHKDLNRAMLAGIKSAGPFPVKSDADKVVFTYRHFFKP